MVLHEVRAKHEACHVDAVLGPLARCYRAHERLARQGEMSQHHIQMPLVDRRVRRLAHRAAGMVQPGRAVTQLHEVLKIHQRCVSATVLQITDKRRSVARHQNDIVASQRHGIGGITAMKLKLPRRFCTQMPGQARLERDPLAHHRRTRSGKQLQRGRVTAKFHANGIEYPVGLILDGGQCGFIQQSIGGYRACTRRNNNCGRGLASGSTTPCCARQFWLCGYVQIFQSLCRGQAVFPGFLLS